MICTKGQDRNYLKPIKKIDHIPCLHCMSYAENVKARMKSRKKSPCQKLMKYQNIEILKHFEFLTEVRMFSGKKN